jgi:bifunctional DNA-binding transcriptional regulator/antitoxin component of YhaV-PrlF toxin-antitoxin module
MAAMKLKPITFETQTHKSQGRFTIPRHVREHLGLSS